MWRSETKPECNHFDYTGKEYGSQRMREEKEQRFCVISKDFKQKQRKIVKKMETGQSMHASNVTARLCTAQKTNKISNGKKFKKLIFLSGFTTFRQRIRHW